MAIKYTTALRTTRITDVLNAIDAGDAALIKIYGGSQPAGPDTAVTTQPLLATLTCSATSGTVSNGVLTFNTITADSSADTDGTAYWARITTSAGAAVADMSVGTTGSGADLILSTTTIVAGGEVSITSGSITEGNA
jgi:hypothetical protein